MKRALTLSTSFGLLLLLVIGAAAQRQESRRRPVAPMLTSEDVLSPSGAPSRSEASVTHTSSSGSPLRNARAVLESSLTKMSDVSSSRTRLQSFLPSGTREILIESVKPDRVRVTSADGEFITIGRKFYVRTAGGWEFTSAPPGSALSDAGFDYRTFLKQMTGKAGARITGKVLGDQMIDGIDTVAYEFTVTDGSETGTLQVNVGKDDGYMRRMFLSGGAVDLKIWFTNINEQISIEAPM